MFSREIYQTKAVFQQARHPWRIRLIALFQASLLLFTGSPSVLALEFSAGYRSSGSGSQAGGGKGSAPSLQNAGAASAALTAALAKQALAKSQAVISGMQKAQQQAAAAAKAHPATTLPNGATVGGSTAVKNGLQLGWLEPYVAGGGPGIVNGTPVTASWTGATITPSANSANAANPNYVNITQTSQNAYLYWKQFNVGPNTTVNFVQSAGGANASQWIAFNKVVGASDPSHIFGNITAQGQVWILNQNGVLFHSGSSVNVQSLVASTLPANTYFTGAPPAVAGVGVMNNPGYQFLFSALQLAPSSQGSDGFTPNPSVGNGSFAANQIGPVIVDPGASITTSVNAANTGGRVLLAGPSVINNGSISTPDGQTILAAGLEVGLNPHAQGAKSADPSLRGYDVYVGAVTDLNGNTLDASGNSVGTVVNNGLISVAEGELAMAGKSVSIGGLNATGNDSAPYAGVTDFSSQATVPGAIASYTSVSLNGRVDLLSAFNATVNPSAPSYYYASSANGSPQSTTGQITVAPGASVSILPSYDDLSTTPASQLALSASTPVSELALSSLIEITGQSISIGSGAQVFAPGALGSPDYTSPYYDMTVPSRPISTPETPGSVGAVLTSGINFLAGNFQPSIGSKSSFLTGSVNGSAPGSITVGAGAVISAAGSTDVAVSGAQNFLSIQLRGAELANSPLQQSSVERGVSLTVDIRDSGTYNSQYWIGTPLGNVNPYVALIGQTVSQLTVNGGTISMQAGDSVNLASGSLVNVSGGYVSYSGGNYSQSELINSYGQLVPMSQATPNQIYTGVVANPTPSYQPGYLSGGNGGQLMITAPSIALNGQLNGNVVEGMRQIRYTATQSSLPSPSLLSLTFQGSSYGSTCRPDVRISAGASSSPSVTFLDPFAFGDASVGGGGFGSLAIQNHDGTIELPAGTVLQLPAGTSASVTLQAASITLGANSGIILPGGNISLTAYDFSYADQIPGFAPTQASTTPVNGYASGSIQVGSDVILNAAGLISQNLLSGGASGPVESSGGTISLTGWNVVLSAGSLLNVSGGVFVQPGKSASYGAAGTVSLSFGIDPDLGPISGGGLLAGGYLSGTPGSGVSLLGLSGPGAASGTLNLSSKAFQIGGTLSPSTPTDVTLLSPKLFNEGGFANFSITGIGLTGTIGAEGSDQETPGIMVAPGTLIHPVVENFLVGATGSQSLYQEPGYNAPASSLKLISTGFQEVGTTYTTWTVRGTTLIGAGAEIQLDPSLILPSAMSTVPTVKTGSLTIGGNITEIGIDASLIVPGGTISVSGASQHPDNLNGANQDAAYATLTLDPGVSISAAGIEATIPDPRITGAVGSVINGGSVLLAGNVVVNPSVTINVSGSSGYLNTHANGAGVGTPGASLFESSGGSVSLNGKQFLVFEGQLVGEAGGPTASGGNLTVKSGFFNDGSSTDNLNQFLYQSVALEVSQQTPTGLPALTHGYFGIDSATGFDNLTLAIGGTGYGYMRFDGNVGITTRASVQLQTTAGISIAPSGSVPSWVTGSSIGTALTINAPYVALGNFGNITPVVPGSPASAGMAIGPVWGSGSVTVDAANIDLAMFSLKNADSLVLNATTGAIRGNGAISVAGSVILNSAQVYPMSESLLQITAFDPTQYGAPSGTPTGSITVTGGGASSLPLEACGSVGLYATTITQSGTLEAPFGQITLGWNGQGIAPVDPVSGASVPTCAALFLGNNSFTSVSGVTPTGTPVTIPYGIVANGEWIDPAGNDITANGLPQKSVTLSATSVTTAQSSVIDVGGGGDLQAFQWNSGNQGTINPYSQALGNWGEPLSLKDNYPVGSKVIDNGTVYAAIAYSTLPQPEPGVGAGWQYYWVKVGSAFAVLPGFSGLTPSSPFAQGSANAYDPGFVSVGYNSQGIAVSNLHPGDSISLAGGGGLAAGTYQLLPSSYAQLPGAYLVISTGTKEDGQAASVLQPDGSVMSAGQRFNALNPTVTPSGISSMFQILSPTALSARANITTDLASTFLPSVAIANPVTSGGVLQVLASGSVKLAGSVRATGSTVVISSALPFDIGGNSAPVDVTPTIDLSAKELSSWNANALFIGGTESITTEGITVNAISSGVTVNDNGVNLSAGDLVLMAAPSGGSPSTGGVVIQDNSSISVSGSSIVLPIIVNGDGSMIRISSDPSATVTRIGFDTAPVAGYTIGNAVISAPTGALTFDSSLVGSIANGATISAASINLKAGRISANYDGSSENDALNLAPGTLALLHQASLLNLTSYSSIDFHGSTRSTPLGSATAALSLHADALIGDGVTGNSITLLGSSILLDNSTEASVPVSRPLSVDPSTQLTLGSGSTITLGVGATEIAGFANVTLNAPSGILLGGTSTKAGSLITDGSLTLNTPYLAGKGNALNEITAGSQLAPPALPLSSLSLINSYSQLTPATPGLGASLSMIAPSVSIAHGTLLDLPSGSITIIANSSTSAGANDLTVAGELDVSGRATFQDNGSVTTERFSDGGSIFFSTATGSISLDSSHFYLGGARDNNGNTGGNAGSLTVLAPNGNALFNGTISALAPSGTAASFTADLAGAGSGNTEDLTTLEQNLSSWGFTGTQNLRIRSGNVLVGGVTACSYTLSTDRGDITINGTINASGNTGGCISIYAGNNLVMNSPSALLDAHGTSYNSAGQGGSITLKAGCFAPVSSGVIDQYSGFTDLYSPGRLKLDQGTIDLHVTSIAGLGQSSGTLLLEAPQNPSAKDLLMDQIGVTINGASAITVAGLFRQDAVASGAVVIDDPNNVNNLQTTALGNSWVFMGNWQSILSRVTAYMSPATAANLQITPAEEIDNSQGSLVLSSDWDLSQARYGALATIQNGNQQTEVSVNGSTRFSSLIPNNNPAGSTLFFTQIAGISQDISVPVLDSALVGNLYVGSSPATLSQIESAYLNANGALVCPATGGGSPVQLLDSYGQPVSVATQPVWTSTADGSTVGLDSVYLNGIAATSGQLATAYSSGGYLTWGTKANGNVTKLTDASGNPINVAPAGTLVDNQCNCIVTTDSGVPVGIGLIGQTAGLLTLRSAGSVAFQGALSDGFGDSLNPASSAGGLKQGGAYYGLAYAPLLPTLVNSSGNPASQSSWSYSISAGNDLTASDPNKCLPQSGPGTGNVQIGNPTDNSNLNTSATATSKILPELNGYYEPIRTGTGNIAVNAGGSIKFLNQFSTVYTAGAQTWDTSLGGEFQLQVAGSFGANNSLTPQEPSHYGVPQYSFNGGNIVLKALADIAHLQVVPDPNNLGSLLTNPDGSLLLIPDSSFQTPNNWLSRSGSQVDGSWQTINGVTYTTTWWINFGNYFEGVATLGGGNLTMVAGGSIRDVDASVATQARIGINGNLAETGGGNLIVQAAQDIVGGVYYEERGSALLSAGTDVKSDASRNAQGYYQNYLQNETPGYYQTYVQTDPSSWLPTSFILGAARMSVKAGGSALVGAVANAFLLPVGEDNIFSTKSYFSTYDPGVTQFSVTALSGDINWRTETQGQPDFTIQPGSYFQPWTITADSPAFANIVNGVALLPANINMVALSGGISLQGNITMAPSYTGNLALYANGNLAVTPVSLANGDLVNANKTLGIDGNYTFLVEGLSQTPPVFTTAYGASQITLSDASPNSMPSAFMPEAQASINSPSTVSFITDSGALAGMAQSLQFTGAYIGNNAPNLQQKLSLHSQFNSLGQSGTLHQEDGTPLQIYSSTGDVTGFTLFSPKFTDVIAGGSIDNVSLYIQNNNPGDISTISAGRNITLYDAQADVIQVGDVQVSGPGAVEVLAGGNIVLGTGAANSDGTGAGIVSIGGVVNPALQSYSGADVIVSSGIGLQGGLSSGSLNYQNLLTQAQNSLNFPDAANYYGELLSSFAQAGNDEISQGLISAGSLSGISSSTALSNEQKARIALQLFSLILRDSGRDHGTPGATDQTYAAASKAISDYLPDSARTEADIILDSRNIRTKNGGSIAILAPSGSVELATTASSAAAAAAPPGIVTEQGGRIDVYAENNISLGIGRIFTLQGGDIMIWSQTENIEAGNSAKSVASAPPTQVLIDPESGAVLTDLAGLSTGGGIGTLQTVAGVAPSAVDLYAPFGVINAGDAGIRSSGNLHLGATAILNAANISVGGLSVGVPAAASSSASSSAPAPAPAAASAPSSAASTAAAAASSAADKTADKGNTTQEDSTPSEYTITIDGYGGGDGDDDDSNKKAASASVAPVQASL